MPVFVRELADDFDLIIRIVVIVQGKLKSNIHNQIFLNNVLCEKIPKKPKRFGWKTSPKREEEIDIECIIFVNEAMQAIVERNVHVKFEGNR